MTPISWLKAQRFKSPSPPLLLLQKQIEIQEMTFIDPQGTLRRTKNKKFPLITMINDIRHHLKKPKKPPSDDKDSQTFKMAFQKFSIEDGQFEFIDEHLKDTPLKTYLSVNAAGDIEGEKGNRRFPFWLNALVEHPEQKGFLNMNGVLSRNPHVTLRSPSFPVQALRDYFGFLGEWDGQLSWVAHWEKGLNKYYWHIKGKTKGLKSLTLKKLPHLKLDFILNSHKESSVQFVFKDQDTHAVLNGILPDVHAPHWTVSLNSPQVLFRGETFKNFQAQIMRVSTHSVSVEDIQLKGLGGDLKASLLLSKPSEFEFHWGVKEVDIIRLMRILKSAVVLSGVGSTSGNLKGDWSDLSWLKTDGEMRLELKDGSIWGVPGFIKTLSKLNLKSLVKKIEGQKEEGMPYDEARAIVNLNNGVVILKEPAIIKNETMELVIMGQADLGEQTVQGQLVFHFLSVLGEVVQAIPGIKTILFRGKKSNVPLWVDVKGPLLDPEVEIRADKIISKSVTNTIGNILSFPKSLWDVIRKNKGIK